MKIFKMDVEICDTTFSKMKGLMFRKELNHALLFFLDAKSTWHSSIHSFFVFFPFDTIWLDKDRRIIDLRENIRPFTFKITPKKPAYFLIEVPAGTIKKQKLRMGQKLRSFK